ncbi:CaiB/BaiF CoA transferase family protein [Pseudorhodoferax soli]|nr:CoA transferase [Pseudorhodoferax soli]
MNDSDGSAAASLPFHGVRVLDASQGLAGPYCGSLLAQQGAEVIKLEPPLGDWSRGIGQRYNNHTAIDLMANRGKKSLAIDIKRDGAAEAVLRLAERCDVFIESFRPGVVDKLGIGYEQVRARNPDVVYLSVSGFGQQGPGAQQAATDTVIQGFSGMMSLNTDAQGRPRRLGFLAVDTLTALYAFQALASALYGRLRGQPGRHIDVSLMQSTAAFLSAKLIEGSLEGDDPVALNVPAGVYRTRDGWIAVTLSKESQYGALCRATGRADLAEEPDFDSFVKRARHAAHLETQFAMALLERGTQDWLAHLAAHGVVASEVNTLGTWFRHPLVEAVDAAPEVSDPSCGVFRMPRTPGVSAPRPGDPRYAWPDVGDSSHALLQSIGCSQAEIDRLLAP